jgi:hypothetical protein
VQLAADVLADIEGDRLPAEPLLFKARRLAHIAGDKDIEEWISWELEGYPATLTPAMEARIDAVGRRWRASQPANPVLAQHGIKQPEITVIRESLPRIEDHILPSLSAANRQNAQRVAGFTTRAKLGFNPRAKKFDPTEWEKGIQWTNVHMIQLNRITKRVRGELHGYVVATYHRFAFSEVANAIFDRHKTMVDHLLRATAEDVIDKVPAIYDRLAAAPDPEAVSQAMGSCRRMIAAFADAVMPPRPEPVVDEAGGVHKLTQQQVLNRIDEHLKKCPSKSRVARLSRTLRYIYDRVSAGMKDDITPGEAQSLFLATYLTLGEIAEAAAAT